MDPMSAQPTPTTTAITTSCLPLPATSRWLSRADDRRAVRFVTDNIEAGDKNVGVNLNADSGRESPRGLWGALGSRAGAEAKSL